ncbi:MAG: YdeI/OmpD-associated family protein [Acidimicrobiia bacterium]
MLRPDLPIVRVTSRAQWRAWLTKHHAQRTGIWAATRKKHAVPPRGQYVSPRDINEECLCFGWIDSKPARIDDEWTALLCTPRKPGSGWSKVNKQRLDALLEAKLVAAPGKRAIAAAKQDGSWTAIDQVDALVEPADLLAAFRKVNNAKLHWDAFPPSTRKAILEWINSAKKEATRQARISETARLAGENIRANQWTPKR